MQLSKHQNPIDRYEEDMHLLDKIFAYLNGYNEWEKSLPRYTLFQALEIFPEAKPFVQKELKEEMKDVRKQLDDLDTYYRREENKILDTTGSYYQVIELKQQLTQAISRLQTELQEKQKRIAFNLARLNDDTPRGEVNIARAKEVPIHDLLTLDKTGKTHCLWHDDKTASLHYYRNTNRIYCFGCQKTGDSIDVVMQQRGCDFISAVQWLCRK